MSLTVAFLNESYLEPGEIWIAQRTDGEGGPAVLRIDPNEVIAITPAGHRYVATADVMFDQPGTSETSPARLPYRMFWHPESAGIAHRTGTLPPGCFPGTPFKGITSVGFSADAGSEAVAGGNRVFHTRIGGLYHDTYSTLDQTCRNNYFHDALGGPYQTLTGYDETGSSNLRAGTISISGQLATVTTPENHWILPGWTVRISDELTPLQVNRYYRVFSVTETFLPTDQATFTFDTEGGAPPPGPVIYYARLWQVRFVVTENNVIELRDASHLASKTSAYSAGIVFSSGAIYDPKKKLYQGALIRSNLIAEIPSQFTDRSYAMQFDDVQRGIVDDNIIGPTRQDAIDIKRSGGVFFSRNHSPAGDLLVPTVGKENAALPESIETRVKDALILSL